MVLTARLDSMPGVIDSGDVGALRLSIEAAQGLFQRIAVLVQYQRGLEAETFQHLGDCPGITPGVLQQCDIDLGTVADHQRHAGIRLRRHDAVQEKG